MAIHDDCLFCKIANHKIESNYIYEDDKVVAFSDINPLTPTHVLIVPKEHYDDICDDIPADTLAAMVNAVKHVAHETGIDATGYRCVTNSGEDGGQTVRHVHVHLLGGRKLNETFGEAQ